MPTHTNLKEARRTHVFPPLRKWGLWILLAYPLGDFLAHTLKVKKKFYMNTTEL